MHRKTRLTIPGAVHHVKSRGIEGRNIFSFEEDKNTFLEMLWLGISKKLGLKKEIHRRDRKNGRSEFRKIFSAVVHLQLGTPVVEIARYLTISGAAVSKALNYGESIANEMAINIVI